MGLDGAGNSTPMIYHTVISDAEKAEFKTTRQMKAVKDKPAEKVCCRRYRSGN
jgi:hypothetical protein